MDLILTRGMNKEIKYKMINRIWFMESFSSQRDIILAVKDFAKKNHVKIEVFASHRENRKEILSTADFAIIEPSEETQRLSFITKIISQYKIDVLYAIKNALWYEQHRYEIEATGVTLITGASNIDLLKLSNNKMDFALFMEQQQLPVVPSILIDNVEQLQKNIAHPPFDKLCIKPVHGIYGMGFWRFENNISPFRILSNPEERGIRPDIFLQLYATLEQPTAMVLMPYLYSPESSVDIFASKGEVLCAIAREKHGSKQIIRNEGVAFELACRCASAMQADGLVNVQTRNDKDGQPLLLEINMRPSGGIGNTLHSGVNLPGLMAMYHLKLLNKTQVQALYKQHFKYAEVISTSSVIQYPNNLTNLITI